MKKQRKNANSYKLIRVTKKNLLLWRGRLILAGNIFVVLFILLIPAVCLAAAFIQGNLSVMLKRFDQDLWLCIVFGIGFGILPVDFYWLICGLQHLGWLRREEIYLGIRFDACLGQKKIRSCTSIYADDDWFIIPRRVYAFHIKYIKRIGDFSQGSLGK